jgi:hypothetical protein
VTTEIPNTDYRYWILCAKVHYGKFDRCGVPDIKTIETRMTGGKRPRFQWRELNGIDFWQGKRKLERLVKLGYKCFPATISGPGSVALCEWGKIVHE